MARHQKARRMSLPPSGKACHQFIFPTNSIFQSGGKRVQDKKVKALAWVLDFLP
jgi:hypothetical protein